LLGCDCLVSSLAVLGLRLLRLSILRFLFGLLLRISSFNLLSGILGGLCALLRLSLHLGFLDDGVGLFSFSRLDGSCHLSLIFGLLDNSVGLRLFHSLLNGRISVGLGKVREILVLVDLGELSDRLLLVS